MHVIKDHCINNPDQRGDVLGDLYRRNAELYDFDSICDEVKELDANEKLQGGIVYQKATSRRFSRQLYSVVQRTDSDDEEDGVEKRLLRTSADNLTPEEQFQAKYLQVRLHSDLGNIGSHFKNVFWASKNIHRTLCIFQLFFPH